MSILKNIKKGTARKPELAFIIAEQGEGKSTLACSAPDPFVLDLEKSTGFIGPDRLEDLDFKGVVLALREFAAGGHGYKTLVIDTVDELERLFDEANMAKTETGLGDFAKFKTKENVGKLEILSLWREIEKVREAGFNVILLGHAALIREREADAAEEADRWGPRVSGYFGNMLREKCDEVWFLRREKKAEKASKRRKKAVMTGRFILYTHPSTLAKAKTRHPMPEEVEIPLNGWPKIAAIIDKAHETVTPEQLAAELDWYREHVGEKDATGARKWIDSQKDKERAARVFVRRVEALKAKKDEDGEG